jgi:hypothetical protein
MAITRITIENFKGIAERVEVDLKPITVLFGANSAGKSTLLQAMLYLRELLERRNADADQLQASGSSIDLGGFRQLVHSHDLDREVKIGVTIEVSDDGLPVIPVMEMYGFESERSRDFADNGLTNVTTVETEVTVGWSKIQQGPEIRSYAISLDGVLFAKLKAESAQQCFLVKCDSEHPTLLNEFVLSDDQDEPPVECMALFEYVNEKNTTNEALVTGGECRVPVYSRSVIPQWGKQILPPFGGSVFWEPKMGEDGFEEYQNYAQAQFILSHILVGGGEAVLEELKKVCYIGPLRAIPERNFSSLRSPREDRWADGMAAWDKLYKSASIPDGNGLVLAASEWLSGRLDLGYSLVSRKSYEVDEDSLALLTLQRLADVAIDEDIEERLQSVLKDIQSSPMKATLSLCDSRTGATVAPCDIGVGVSQVIPVVVGAMVGDGNLVAIEQPELHLHPAVQSRLGDLFLHSAVTEDNKRFILESHSEHLMLRLLRRIRETTEDGEADVDYLGAIKPEHVAVYYVHATETKTEMRPLRISEDGDFLDRWPNGFFEERAEELF